MGSTRRQLVRTLAATFTIAVLVGPSIGSADPSTVRLLVKFGPGASAATRAHALGAAGASEIGSIRDIDVEIGRVPATRADAALHALKSNPNVQYTEVDQFAKPQEVLPNDPYFLNSGSWNLGGGAWGWYATHTTQAWDITEGDPSTVIAILDTGLKPAGLTDFGGQVSSTWNVLSNSTDVTSNAGNHGTYVAGVAALAMNNGAGNAGYCPRCSLMIVQVGTDTGATWSDLANGITWAADHGARVANMSWAGTSDSPTLQSAINYAHSKGMVLTAAAGNSNCNCVTYPSADQNVLGVAGVSNASGTKQGDSNFGNWVKLAAPEGNLTAWPSINGAPGYASVGGTSLAAPVVAGIAGLLFSYDPQLTNTQVEEALEASAAPVSFTVQYGRVDALAALQYLGASDPQPSSAPLQTAAPQIYYEQNGWTSIAPLAGPPVVGQVLVRGIGGWTGSSGLAVSGLQWQRCASDGPCALAGTGSTYTVLSTDTGSTIKLVFAVKNPVGSVPVSVSTQIVGGGSSPPPPPPPPANQTPPSVTGTAQAGQTLSATTGTWSGTPTSYAYQWQRCDASGEACASVTGATASSYVAQTADVGATLRVSVTASNSGGTSVAASAATAAVTPTPTSPPPSSTQTTTFSGSLNGKTGSASFNVTVGAGTAHAALSFSRCSSMTLSASGGGSTSGAGALSLDSTVAAGMYTYTVSGSKCSFTLAVTAPKP